MEKRCKVKTATNGMLGYAIWIYYQCYAQLPGAVLPWYMRGGLMCQSVD